MSVTWKPRAVLFDFDGTLVDSFPAIAASVNHVRSLHHLPPLSLEVVRRFVGWGAEKLLSNTVPGWDLSVCVAAYREHHPSVLASGTQLLPGAVELLAALHQIGCPLGVTSNKPRVFTTELLRLLRIDPYFRVVLGPEDVARAKPAPDMLLAALQQLNLRPDEALYVGDMTVDIATGHDAGVRVWAVGTGTQSREVLEAAGPEAFFDDLAAIQHRLTTLGLL